MHHVYFPASTALPKLDVLIIEDNLRTQMRMAGHFDHYLRGHPDARRIKTHFESEERLALENLVRNVYRAQVILWDHSLFDDYTLKKIIPRFKPVFKDSKIILMTRSRSPQLKRKLTRAGIGYLYKDHHKDPSAFKDLPEYVLRVASAQPCHLSKKPAAF